MIDYFADCANEGNYFLKFIDTKFRQNILYQTNLYVTQKHRRVPVATANELYAFLKIDLLMGYHTLPAIKQYWLNDVDLKVSLMSDAMPRNRYQQILANLHVNDNNAMPENNTDKLYRIRPFVDALNNNFILLYNVNEHISVDESMILFKGRSSMKQYIPMKPIKRDYKISSGQIWTATCLNLAYTKAKRRNRKPRCTGLFWVWQKSSLVPDK